MHAFIECPKKNAVQEKLLKQICWPLPATVLCGQTPDRYIELLRSTSIFFPTPIYAYELNEMLIEEVHPGVIFLKKDITFAPVTPFVDLDLCAGLYTSRGLICKMFQEQKIYVSGARAFMFTVSTRNRVGYSLIDIHRCIEEMCSAKLNSSWTKSKKKLSFKFLTGIFSIYIIRYKDTTPMLSCLITY